MIVLQANDSAQMQCHSDQCFCNISVRRIICFDLRNVSVETFSHLEVLPGGHALCDSQERLFHLVPVRNGAEGNVLSSSLSSVLEKNLLLISINSYKMALINQVLYLNVSSFFVHLLKSLPSQINFF